ncbi:AAA domain-containing protein [Granulicatella balaenopterae]|uniref:AAA domain-containing protein n=1 Tax=Granulicatella balaenopterae TaxID=137733 RepID=A0A1H9IPM3_9LACT|nr:ATP-binding protein [Granulicatella balaenopterae]SEQ76442.1 AAA domain-containing protein [Granulicatella balaenopterae]
MLQITKGIKARAQKVVIYGTEGIGKSTLAAQFPNTVFIDTEGSTDNMDVARFPKPQTWNDLMHQIDYVSNTPGICDTLVIDTIDWAEHLAIAHLCYQYGKNGIEDFGYGYGYVYLAETITELLNKLQQLIDKGINVVLTAHATIKAFTKPDEMGQYDRFELKLGKKSSPLVKEWADMVLFCNYQTTIITDSKTKKDKAFGGERVIHTEHHPAWDAKNRHGLPATLPLSYDAIAHIFNKPAPTPTIPQQPTQQEPAAMIGDVWTPNQGLEVQQTEQVPEFLETSLQNFGEQPAATPPNVPQELADLMQAYNVTIDDVMQVVYQKGHAAPGTPMEAIPVDYWTNTIVANWMLVMQSIQYNHTNK